MKNTNCNESLAETPGTSDQGGPTAEQVTGAATVEQVTTGVNSGDVDSPGCCS